MIRTPSGYKIRIRSLLDWNPNESDLLSCFIRNLKGKDNKKDWSYFARQFVNQHNLLELKKSYELFPCWSRFYNINSAVKIRCHASLFASELHKNIPGNVHDSLVKKADQAPQTKRLGRQARLKQSKDHEIFSMYSNAKIQFLESQGCLVFVDDIVTTGSTAEVAFKALGCPNHFEVWCLAYRTHLRSRPIFDTLQTFGDL